MADRIFGNEEDGISALPGTKFTAIPATGAAHFAGFAAVSAINSDTTSGLLMLGNATVEVNFDSRTFSGIATDFQAISLRNEDDFANYKTLPATDATGTITLQGGSILSDLPNRFGSVQYGGIVAVAGTDHVFSGEAEGKFYGTRAEGSADGPIKAIQMSSTTGSVRVDELTSPSDLYLIAESK